jgi:hypothetical protein
MNMKEFKEELDIAIEIAKQTKEKSDKSEYLQGYQSGYVAALEYIQELINKEKKD